MSSHQTDGSEAGVVHSVGVEPSIQEPWDERYASKEQLWSGQPNGALVSEIRGLTPGRALDVGCGEGADAIWLAQQGWDVTALDVSRVALDRAVIHANAAQVQVRWLHSGLIEAALPAGSFDLVSAQYPALFVTDDRQSERALLNAVAPGGVVLFVHHPPPTKEQAHAHGFDPADYIRPSDVVASLDESWRLDVDETRPRNLTTGAGAGHTEDLVVRAQRRS